MDAVSILLIIIVSAAVLAVPMMVLGIEVVGFLRYAGALLLATSLGLLSYVSFGWLGALLAILFSYAVLQVSFAFGLPTDWLTGPIGQATAACVGFFRDYVVDRPTDLVVAVAAALCALQTAVILCTPTKVLHWLSAERWSKFAVMARLGPIADMSERWRLNSWIVAGFQWLSKWTAILMLLPFVSFLRVVGSPSTSRLLILGVFAPYAAASAIWRFMPSDAVASALPIGWVDTGEGADRQMIVWVSIAAFFVYAAPLWALRSYSRTLVEWLAGGEVTSAVVLGGAAAAFLAACVISGLQSDADASAPPSGDPTAISPATPADAHLAALLVCLLAVAAVHATLPAFNRRDFAILRLSGR